VSSTFSELLKEIREKDKEFYEQEIEAVVKETENLKKQPIQTYFAIGGKDPAFIAKIMNTSVEDVEKIRSEMESNG